MKKHELSNESPTVPGHIPLLYTAIGVGNKNRDYVREKRNLTEIQKTSKSLKQSLKSRTVVTVNVNLQFYKLIQLK